MHTEELVRSWKQPGTRQGRAVDHPSGEITLRSGGRLARRYGLLTANTDVVWVTPTLTQSCPLTPEPTGK
ncbi:hypothetical protein GXW83_22585 [Streptacidiphilus sp. PB12-B1b]|uniref:hypothetical protein n=1 Tax=Streptacidiphilus sp. PB12-B1b TaxID=2705012 RepID=UPI0015FDCB28|nr:hypothetical protein [Streptacidiphilus sp. PB12-B1b]QMU78068.1 hypothetical protein GXW83_22585 [Streptacidiphilus sp. PB12-B1b]